uniref:Uncharacterized protein n=1 Tax=Meloidogyne enterolobii TaxID=390850 RepID=A0A6V7V4S0_MELEN|nr:unnamed protein product [Meloidogyne enterolobii]CAD2169423.1 unnamed protein product [Meloidogyne enterolobii]CAD2202993.1 unnamed protein product [Meloidogyne enterolobii]
MMFPLLYSFLTLLALYNVSAGKNLEISMEGQGRNCTFSGVGKCPKGFVCLRGLCAKRCYYKGQCPDGYLCQHAYACKCKKPGDCPQGWSCYITKCRRQECHSKKDCEFEWPCQMGKCRTKSCAKDKDCPENWKCGKTRKCMKIIKENE